MIKKATQIVSFRFGDVQLLDILNFVRGATRLDSFLRAYKISQRKNYFSVWRVRKPEKLNKIQIFPYETFFNKLRNNAPLEIEYSCFQIVICRSNDIQRSIMEIQNELTSSNWTKKELDEFARTRKHVYLWRLFALTWQRGRFSNVSS